MARAAVKTGISVAPRGLCKAGLPSPRAATRVAGALNASSPVRWISWHSGDTEETYVINFDPGLRRIYVACSSGAICRHPARRFRIITASWRIFRFKKNSQAAGQRPISVSSRLTGNWENYLPWSFDGKSPSRERRNGDALREPSGAGFLPSHGLTVSNPLGQLTD